MPLKVGDANATVAQWRVVMNKRFGGLYTRLHGPLPTDTNVFGPRAAEWQKEYESRTGQPTDGVVSDSDLRGLGIAVVTKPVMFTVEGHMSNMFAGPVADTATALENEGRLHHQPIGYNNGAIPFDNASGVNELARLVGATALDNGTPFPAGTPWVLGGYSQGGIVITDFYLNHLLPGCDLAWRLPDLRGVLAYGNPCRETGSVAPWSRAQAGPAANGGIDPLVRFGRPGIPEKPANWMDVYRKGDIFADNEPNTGVLTAPTSPLAGALGGLGGLGSLFGLPATATSQLSGLLSGGGEGDVKSAVYQAVARADLFSNPFSLVTQISNLFSKPFDEVLAIFEAIISGIGFLAKQDNPHYAPFDISGGINWVRGLL